VLIPRRAEGDILLRLRGRESGEVPGTVGAACTVAFCTKPVTPTGHAALPSPLLNSSSSFLFTGHRSDSTKKPPTHTPHAVLQLALELEVDLALGSAETHVGTRLPEEKRRVGEEPDAVSTLKTSSLQCTAIPGPLNDAEACLDPLGDTNGDGRGDGRRCPFLSASSHDPMAAATSLHVKHLNSRWPLCKADSAADNVVLGFALGSVGTAVA
jgi:hypothetical protein